MQTRNKTEKEEEGEENTQTRWIIPNDKFVCYFWAACVRLCVCTKAGRVHLKRTLHFHHHLFVSSFKFLQIFNNYTNIIISDG